MRGKRSIGTGLLLVALGFAGFPAHAQGESLASAIRCPLEPGRSSFEISVGGNARKVEVEIGPKAGKDGPAPVVFAWHGWGGDARNQLAALRAKKYWPEAVVVAPQGLARRFPGGGRARPGWQISSGEFNDRDVRLFDALVLELSKRDCLDATRFVSSGFSNGGYFSNLLGCRRGRVLAAIAPVGSGGPYESCETPVAAWIAHGKSDRIVRLRDGEASFLAWQERNGCAEKKTGSEGCVEAQACRRETVLCTFDGGHFWPHHLTADWARFLRDQRQPAAKQP